jgi:hypothetical protein
MDLSPLIWTNDKGIGAAQVNKVTSRMNFIHSTPSYLGGKREFGGGRSRPFAGTMG